MKRMKAKLMVLGILVTLAGQAINAFGQAAGAGAVFNNSERAAIQERQRLDRVDPPIRPDPLGNAIIGGVVTGTIRGAAAGATSAARGAAVGSAVQSAKESINQSRQENQRTGRGGPNDPRYNPGTLFNK